MCTLTAIPAGPGYRLAFNRDERPARAPALPPTVTGRAVFPVDPESGGTWLAATDTGLSLAVLNGNPRRGAPAGRVSRGRIIPGLLDATTPGEAVVRAAALALADYAPFRLVAVGGGVVADLRWDGSAAQTDSRPLDRPVLFTSSGLGDAVVTPPRTALFDELFAAPADWPAAQDAFHRHAWPGREHLSVNMRRAGARTVSFAVVEVGAGCVRFVYHPAAPDEAGADTVLELPLAAGVPA